LRYLFLFPVASIVIIATLAISLWALYKDESLIDKFILHPYGMIRRNEYYRIFSHAFIHADLWHLFFNMFSFYSFAFYLEANLGSLRFFIVYFGSILASVYTCIQKNKMNPTYRSLGASGGVSGVIFGFILFEPMAKISIMFIPIGIPAFIFAFLYLAYSYYSAENQYDNINHEAHFYGAVAGLALTSAFEPAVLSHFIRSISL